VEDGRVAGPSAAVRARLPLARLDYRPLVTSTMDVAHALAQDGAPAGTLVLASQQSAGRGRNGRPWHSEPDAGLWGTLLERPADARALTVLSLRVGLRLAEALAPLVDGAILLKWPNDLLVVRRKLAGVLIEVRWRDGRPEWVAIGIGINRRAPSTAAAASGSGGLEVATVRPGITMDELLLAVVPAVRAAAASEGPLTLAECAAWGARDVALGRRVVAPVEGVVIGLTADGAVEVRGDDAVVRTLRSGSLEFAESA
jgi:BirA family biotin operon repressor/biotin-[acetyl-CoA-carboxylase] ligase